MIDKPVDNVLCSFCKKAQDDVRRPIAGPEVNICDECVEVCVDIIVDGTRVDDASGQSTEAQRWMSVAGKFAAGSGACSLCGKRELSGYMATLSSWPISAPLERVAYGALTALVTDAAFRMYRG
jgi:hypothetical protein